MWLVFVISALLIAGFVAQLAAALRQRDRQLARWREKALRDEQILTLGMFAAGAAHELGTPLSTIAVLAKELEHGYGEDDRRSAPTCASLRQQVEVCKEHSRRLAQKRRSGRPTARRRKRLDVLLEHTRNRWQCTASLRAAAGELRGTDRPRLRWPRRRPSDKP
jgi:two-component system sensor histidine kinase RegB